MATSLFKVISSEVAATSAAAINYTNASVTSKVIAGTTYLAVVGSTDIGGVCVDQSGNIYLSDVTKHIILKVSEGGQVRVVAGLANTSGINGTLTVSCPNARFNAPRGLSCDKSGNIYVCDTGNNQIRVIRGDKVSVVAGNGGGASGFADGVGGAATFSSPYDIAANNTGVLYVADKSNNSIRKIVDGTVTTWAGSVSGDHANVATTTAALFNAPETIDVDNAGNVYVGDTGNDKVKMIVPRGWVYRFSGSTDGKAIGKDAFDTQFKSIKGLAIDNSGNVYVIDRNAASGSRLLRLTQNGVANVIADLAGATTYNAALLGVAVSPAQKLFVVCDAT